MSVYITGCEKEKNMLPETQNDEISTRSVTNEQPTQEEIAIAKQLFYLQIQNVASTPEEDKGPLMDIWTSFVPSWKTGEVIAKTNYRLILFPTFTGVDESNYKLAFVVNDNNDSALGLIGYERTNLNAPESFTGKIYQITYEGYTANEILIKNNLPVGFYFSPTNIRYFSQNSNELEFRGGDGINNWLGIENFWQYFFGDQKDVLDSDDDEGEGSGGIRINHNLPTIGCYEPCPNGYSYENCKHPRDCGPFDKIKDCESAQEVFPNCECIETPTSIKIICDGGDDGDDDDIIIPINDDDLDNDDGLTTGGGGGGGHKKTLEDIISEITQNSEIYESCEGEVDPETNASFNPMFEYQEFLNFSADELLSMWGNNTAEALVNAILSSDGDLANSIYSQPKQQDGLEYDQDNPVHQAALQAVQALLANINSAGSEDACNSIMKMSDFVTTLKELLKQEQEKLCSDNLNTFISNYNLDLTQEQKDEILYNTNVSCGDDDQAKFEEEAELIYNKYSKENSDGIIDIMDIKNGEYSGDKEHIPNCIKITDNKEITVNFGTTSSDNKSADQEVAVCLVQALVEALKCASKDYDISSIYISATTNGKHSETSNHTKALAIDLSRINGVKMANMNEEKLKIVEKIQECLEDYSGIRENFGPKMKKKLGKDYDVSDHSDHIHFSINSDTSCTFNSNDVKCN